MLETLLAVLVLGLVVTASLKLAALSNRGLREAREMEALMRDAAVIQISAASDPLNIFGTSGDVSWTVSEKYTPMFDMEEIDIAALSFARDPSGADQSRGRTNTWRELEVTRGGKSLTLLLPKPSGTSSGDQK
jgi:type II secretory pathway pseudopilin PulG